MERLFKTRMARLAPLFVAAAVITACGDDTGSASGSTANGTASSQSGSTAPADGTSAGASAGTNGGSGNECAPALAEPALPCDGAAPFTYGGLDVPVAGWEVCDSGLAHRTEAVQCELPPGECEPGMGEDECTVDADCTDAPNGRCEGPLGMSPACACLYGCETDADCGDNQACLCLGVFSECIAADCRTDADCGEGSACTLDESDPSCGPSQGRMTCTTTEDSCTSAAGCGVSDLCVKLDDDTCGFRCSENPFTCADA